MREDRSEDVKITEAELEAIKGLIVELDTVMIVFQLIPVADNAGSIEVPEKHLDKMYHWRNEVAAITKRLRSEKYQPHTPELTEERVRAIVIDVLEKILRHSGFGAGEL